MIIRVKGKPYMQCDRCGANLDPGERCGCQDGKKKMEPKKGGRGAA